ncbi:MAG: SDR family oxidoreductase [Anaerolineae bacterium]|nr:SDR family oxidoreductase [Anaerolineae bacterium]
MQLQNKTVVITGGSKGIGRGIVAAFSETGANVWAIARSQGPLDTLKQEFSGVQTWAADIAHEETASHVMREIRPDILILNAGATPTLRPVQTLSWQQFSQVWNTDVKSTFTFGKESLTMPMAPGSVVVIMSSGAALQGSPLSGDYAGAKRMQWLLANYLQQQADALNLGIRFIALLPKQILGDTELGHAASSAYAASQGISKAAFLERFGAPLTPNDVGQGILKLLTEARYQNGTAFTITSQGLEAIG